MTRRRCRVIAFFGTFVLIFLYWFPALAQEKRFAQGTAYVGAETCKGCHPELFEAFRKDTPHWKNYEDPKVSLNRKGCEACHGGGQRHAEEEGKGFIFSFKDLTAQERSEACLKCHQREKAFFGARRSAHKLSAVGCDDCHQIHKTPSAPKLLKAKETDLCLRCHAEVKAQFRLPTRHKVLEGALKCTDCHTPHGKRTRASLRSATPPGTNTCFKCHPEKKGPWVYEHLGGKVEGCTICHLSHGSANRFLLTRRDARMLCAECHGIRHFAQISCLKCHSQIHGSQFSSRFFQ